MILQVRLKEGPILRFSRLSREQTGAQVQYRINNTVT